VKAESAKEAGKAGTERKHRNAEPGRAMCLYFCNLCEDNGFTTMKFLEIHLNKKHPGQYKRENQTRKRKSSVKQVKVETPDHEVSDMETEEEEEGTSVTTPSGSGVKQEMCETPVKKIKVESNIGSVLQQATPSGSGVKQEMCETPVKKIKVENNIVSVLQQAEPPFGWMELGKVKIEPIDDNGTGTSWTTQSQPIQCGFGQGVARKELRQPGPKNFACMICSKDYASKRSATNHVIKLHKFHEKSASTFVRVKFRNINRRRSVSAATQPTPLPALLSGNFFK